MRHLAAFLMCVIGGNASPSAADVTKVVTACGGAVDEEKLAALMADMEGKTVADMLAAGMEKVNKCAVAGAAAPAAGAAAPAAAAPAKVKEEEVDPMEGGMSMFGGGDGGDY
jgi:large subunit ribosomal protein LP2